MQYQTNSQLQLAFDFVQYTNRNIFLTGKAGTGKTTFLKNLKAQSPKRMVVVAPTGVAAINAKGVTIHSFFQISFGPQIPHDPNVPRKVEVGANGGVSAGIKRFNKDKINIIRSLDLLVIDEISMVRADLLDAIDEVLRRYKDRSKPFGGVQLLMIGDLQQLAPIVKDEEWALLRPYYETCYFFSSRALKQSGFVPIELKHIFRQSDLTFIELLNNVRTNQIDARTLKALNERYVPDFQPDDKEGYITLTTHNYQSQQINGIKLSQLSAKSHLFNADVDGDFPEYSYPADPQLVLKVGAQVMFVKNDSSYEKRYYNGKIGKVISIDEDFIKVQCPGDELPIYVNREEWQNSKYALNEKTQEIEENVVGRFEQYPLKTAWAITIHKSQGLTFEKAIIDARQSFAHGQVYVALSRCKTLEGVVLRSPIEVYSVKNDATVLGFTQNAEAHQPNQQQLDEARKQYQLMLLKELFDFKYLFNQMGYVLRLLNENGRLVVGTLHDVLQMMQVPVQSQMISVGLKFNYQLSQMMQDSVDVEGNPAVQERVTKAGTYFLDKLLTVVVKPFNNASFETDNKAIRKSITDARNKLAKEIELKKVCLEEVIKGFHLKEFIEIKSKAAIDKSTTKSKAGGSAASLSNLKYPVFYKQMREWRADKADELNVTISRVVSQKTMIDIANELPANRNELKSIKGMGGVKLKEFGKDILSMVLVFRKSEGLEIPFGADKEIENISLSTAEISLKLFKEGNTVKEIAQQRQLATSTIEGHLVKFVDSGDLDYALLVDADRIAAISKLFDQNPRITTTEARAKLGEDFSYNEVRMVLGHLNRG
jgi:nucleoside-triphosphatase THEP1